MKEPVKEKEFQEDLDKLVTLGKKKGFLTYEDVNETLSPWQKVIELLAVTIGVAGNGLTVTVALPVLSPATGFGL